MQVVSETEYFSPLASIQIPDLENGLRTLCKSPERTGLSSVNHLGAYSHEILRRSRYISYSQAVSLWRLFSDTATTLELEFSEAPTPVSNEIDRYVGYFRRLEHKLYRAIQAFEHQQDF
jgi:hypothetical protein